MYSIVRVGRTLVESTSPGVAYYRERPTRVWRTIENVLYVYPGVAYSRERPTRVWRTLEYATSKEECALESKSCLECVAAPIPARLNRATPSSVRATPSSVTATPSSVTAQHSCLFFLPFISRDNMTPYWLYSVAMLLSR